MMVAQVQQRINVVIFFSFSEQRRFHVISKATTSVTVVRVLLLAWLVCPQGKSSSVFFSNDTVTWHTNNIFFHSSVCLCVCLCVCVWERQTSSNLVLNPIKWIVKDLCILFIDCKNGLNLSWSFLPLIADRKENAGLGKIMQVFKGKKKDMASHF